jgi:hypothetical protein
VGPSHNPEPGTGHTLFSLVYGSEALLPTEVEHKSFCVQHFKEEQSDDPQVNDLTRLQELRKAAVIQSAKHQQAMRRCHARNVCSHGFHVTPTFYKNKKRFVQIGVHIKMHIKL